MTDTWNLFADVADITGWLDDANPDSAHEDSMRVLKLTEEAGEAAAAYIGMVGQNPRKGVTHTREQFLDELADVAITALCAIQHFTKDVGGTRAVLAAKLAGIIERAGIPTQAEIDAANATAPTHYTLTGLSAACGESTHPGSRRDVWLAHDPDDERIDCPHCRAWLASQRRSGAAWEKLYGFTVLDPDGWRSAGDPAWTDPIGLPEFYRRACESTTNMAATGAAERIRRDLEFLPQETTPAAAGETALAKLPDAVLTIQGRNAVNG